MNLQSETGAGRTEVTAPPSRSESKDSISQAVELLKARHQVKETSAYTILVQASVDAHMSVRDTAKKIIDAARMS